MSNTIAFCIGEITGAIIALVTCCYIIGSFGKRRKDYSEIERRE